MSKISDRSFAIQKPAVTSNQHLRETSEAFIPSSILTVNGIDKARVAMQSAVAANAEDKYTRINDYVRLRGSGLDRQTSCFPERRYEMSEGEYAAMCDWVAEHNRKHDVAYGTVAQQFSVIFTTNSIGVSTVISCLVCGDTRDVTDLDLW